MLICEPFELDQELCHLLDDSLMTRQASKECLLGWAKKEEQQHQIRTYDNLGSALDEPSHNRVVIRGELESLSCSFKQTLWLDCREKAGPTILEFCYLFLHFSIFLWIFVPFFLTQYCSQHILHDIFLLSALYKT